MDIKQALKDSQDNIFIPKTQKSIIRQNLLGEEAEHFVQIVEELKETVANAPNLYETDGKKDKKPVLHYFYGSYDAYAFELDKNDGTMFGYVSLGYGYELGYFYMDEINTVPRIELDLYFDGKLPLDINEGYKKVNKMDIKKLNEELDKILMDEINSKTIKNIVNKKQDQINRINTKLQAKERLVAIKKLFKDAVVLTYGDNYDHYKDINGQVLLPPYNETDLLSIIKSAIKIGPIYTLDLSKEGDWNILKYGKDLNNPEEVVILTNDVLRDWDYGTSDEVAMLYNGDGKKLYKDALNYLSYDPNLQAYLKGEVNANSDVEDIIEILDYHLYVLDDFLEYIGGPISKSEGPGGLIDITNDIRVLLNDAKLEQITWDSVGIGSKYKLENGGILEITDMGEDHSEPYISFKINGKHQGEYSEGRFNRLQLQGYKL